MAQAGQRRPEGEDGVRQEWERERCKNKPQMREYGPYIGHVRLQSEVEGRARGTFEGGQARRQQSEMWITNGRGTSSGATVGTGGGEDNAGPLRDWRDRGNGCGADVVGVNCAATGWPRPGMGKLEHGAGAGGAALGGGHRPGRLAKVYSRRAVQGPQREYSSEGGS